VASVRAGPDGSGAFVTSKCTEFIALSPFDRVVAVEERALLEEKA
jgi:hypothetical protein